MQLQIACNWQSWANISLVFFLKPVSQYCCLDVPPGGTMHWLSGGRGQYYLT